ncbi:hypothetical protein [Enterobacter cloacae]|uniref:ParB/RepB/Spo0J family partition protein n=1 Tax=Enterobacter cloacae TaxID=550 RepID=UPI003170025E
MTDQKIFIAGYFPDEESEKAGIKRVATAFNAKDIERAKAKANFIFLEEYEHAQDAAFKTLVCEDTPDVPGRPSRGTWDEEFLYKYDWPEDIGHPEKRQAEKVDFDKLSRELQIAVLIKYGSTELTKSDLPGAMELTQEDDSFEGHMYAAIIKTPSVANMFLERIENAIGWLGAKCDHSAKWPEIQKELAAWEKRQNAERKQTGSSKSVVDIAREKAAAEKLRKQNPAPVHLQDEESLKRNIALGLVAKAMDFDILNPPASIVNRAREIIKLKEKPFPAWFAAMSATLGIYEYSTVQIIYSVKISPEDIHVKPGFNKRLDDERTRQADNDLFQFLMNGGSVPPLEVISRDEGGVWIVEGHRRHRCYERCRKAGKPVNKIHIVQFVGDDKERLARILTSNNQLSLSELEQAAVVKELASAFNQSVAEIAALVNKSEPTVRNLLTLAGANHDVKQKVQAGEVTAGAAIERVKEFGEKAGKVLEQDKAVAAAAGKKKVTRSVIAPEISVKKARRLVELITLAGINESGAITLSGELLNEVVEIINEQREIEAQRSRAAV